MSRGEITPEFERQFELARKAGERALKLEPVGKSVRYDTRRQRIIIELQSGVSFLFPVRLAEGLADASPADLRKVELSPSGQGLHWPTLDVDLSIPHLLQGIFGSRSWMKRLSDEPATGTHRRTAKR